MRCVLHVRLFESKLESEACLYTYSIYSIVPPTCSLAFKRIVGDVRVTLCRQDRFAVWPDRSTRHAHNLLVLVYNKLEVTSHLRTPLALHCSNTTQQTRSSTVQYLGCCRLINNNNTSISALATTHARTRPLSQQAPLYHYISTLPSLHIQLPYTTLYQPRKHGPNAIRARD